MGIRLQQPSIALRGDRMHHPSLNGEVNTANRRLLYLQVDLNGNGASMHLIIRRCWYVE